MLSQSEKRELLKQFANAGLQTQAIDRKERLRSQFKQQGYPSNVAITKAWEQTAKEFGIFIEDMADPFDEHVAIITERLLNFLESRGIQLNANTKAEFEEMVSDFAEDTRTGWI